MQGSIKERIRKTARDAQGRLRATLKVYDVYYRYTDLTTGKKKQAIKRGFLRKSDAEAFLLDINKKQSEGKFLNQKPITIAEYLLQWLNDYVKINVRASSYVGYERIIKNHLIPYIGNTLLKNLTAMQIDNLYAELLQNGRSDGKGGLSQKSVQYTHRVLNESLEHAVKKQLIYFNPMKGITNTPKPKKFQATIYTAKELLYLLNVAKDTPYELPIALAGICGLRRGECLGLKISDIDFSTKTIKISRQLILLRKQIVESEPKSTDSNRVIAVPDMVMEIIQKQIRVNNHYKQLLQNEYFDKGYLICHNNGTPIRPDYLTKNFANFIQSKGLKKIRFHDLRHTCASLMLKSGVAMKTASEILGHSSISITADLYTHVLQDTKQVAANQIEQLLINEKDSEN